MRQWCWPQTQTGLLNPLPTLSPPPRRSPGGSRSPPLGTAASTRSCSNGWRSIPVPSSSTSPTRAFALSTLLHIAPSRSPKCLKTRAAVLSLSTVVHPALLPPPGHFRGHRRRDHGPPPSCCPPGDSHRALEAQGAQETV